MIKLIRRLGKDTVWNGIQSNELGSRRMPKLYFNYSARVRCEMIQLGQQEFLLVHMFG